MPLPDPASLKQGDHERQRRQEEREHVSAWVVAARRREAKRQAQIEKVLDYVREKGSPRPPR